MNILFLNPPFKGRFSRASRSPAVSKGGTLYYPIWLAYAAGVAEQAGHAVRLVDAPAEGLNVADIFRRLDGFEPDLVVADTSTPSIDNDIRVMGALKEKYAKAFYALVGTHVSALAEETLKSNPGIHAVAVAEYDHTIRDLAAALEAGDSLQDVSGLVFKDRDRIVRNDPRAPIENLDQLPFVASVYQKHLNIENYFFAAANYPMVMIITGRGCPYGCFFCVYPQLIHGRRYRMRSAENVVREIEFILENFPQVKEIGFEDDCFTAHPGRVQKICEIIIAKAIKIKWYCNVRGDVGYELLKLMQQAGCRLVTVGFESGNAQVLKNIRKGQAVQGYHEFAKNARRAGILVHGCIMAGNPGDTRQTLKESYEFAKKINCDSMQFYPLYVYPGTQAYDWAEKNGYLKTQDFSKWVTQNGMHNCVIATPALSSADMVSLCDHYLQKYHLRPSYLITKTWQALCNPSEGYRTVKSAVFFLSKILAGHLGKGR